MENHDFLDEDLQIDPADAEGVVGGAGKNVSYGQGGFEAKAGPAHYRTGKDGWEAGVGGDGRGGYRTGGKYPAGRRRGK